MNITKSWDDFLTFSPGDKRETRIFFAPGRVNLIGEHIDYNGGLVLPAALTLGTWLFIRERHDGISRFASADFPNIITTSITSIHKGESGDFANYMKGIYQVMADAGSNNIPAGDFYLISNLPNQAGLSSSAAVELVTAYALNALGGLQYSTVDLVQLAQKAENEFVGVQCGVMDQFAVGMGKADHAILLNTDTLDYEYIPANLDSYRLVITNTNKARKLSDSKYNERRKECDLALQQLRKHQPAMRYLVEDNETLNNLEAFIDHPILIKRARHVMTENQRVIQAVVALKEHHLEQFGQLLNESHRSLRDDYEVTGPELDALVEAQWQVEGCLGSRMTGAGFGGCTVSLVHETAIIDFKSSVTTSYLHTTGLQPSFYMSAIGDGVREVTHEVNPW